MLENLKALAGRGTLTVVVASNLVRSCSRHALSVDEGSQSCFLTILMDSWYTSKQLLFYIKSLAKTYYCPMKSNRLADDSQGKRPYQRIDGLQRTVSEQTSGKEVKLHKFPKDHKVKVFRMVSSRHTDYVVTNDLSQSNISATQQVCSRHWKVEQFQRAAKQLTGLKKCQYCLPRIVRNHIGAVFLIWVHLIWRSKAV